MGHEGLIHIYTGDGKGKTSAAVGLAARAAGSGLRVLFVQFLKGRATGEIESLERLGVHTVRSQQVTKFIPYMNEQERTECRMAQQECLREARNGLAVYDVVILDEAIGAAQTGMVALAELEDMLRTKPTGVELVLTGRDAPETLVELADYVSDIKAVKHPYDRGIQARKGIEY